MNYRHIYHAGNFADVFKHIVLLQLLAYLRLKEKPFFVLDTHAGLGLYDLKVEEAAKTGEAAAGIGALWERRDVPEPVAEYLSLVRGMTNGRKGELRHYPGSPLIIRTMLRDDDRMVANELHPDDHRVLLGNMSGDKRVRVEQMDGYQLLKSHLPPRERRGLVLIDPPFEARDEFAQMVRGVDDAMRRWPTGIYALWYPIKSLAPVEDFLAALRPLAGEKFFAAHFMVRPLTDPELFNGSGLALINPPWTLRESMAAWGPWLANVLGGGAASFIVTPAEAGITAHD